MPEQEQATEGAAIVDSLNSVAESLAVNDRSSTPSNKPTEWDKRKQADDQRHANERKALETDKAKAEEKAKETESRYGEVSGQVSSLAEQVKALTESLKAAPQPKGEKPDAQVPQLDVKALEDEFGEDNALVKVIKGLHDQIVTLGKKAGPSEELTEIKATLAEVLQRTGQITDNAALTATLKALDDQYGAEFRNKALAAAKQYFGGKGFSTAKPPPVDRMAERLETEYAKLALAGKGKKSEDGPDPDAFTDSGSGGRTADGLPVTGNNETVLADMKSSGKYRDITYD